MEEGCWIWWREEPGSSSATSRTTWRTLWKTPPLRSCIKFPRKSLLHLHTWCSIQPEYWLLFHCDVAILFLFYHPLWFDWQRFVWRMTYSICAVALWILHKFLHLKKHFHQLYQIFSSINNKLQSDSCLLCCISHTLLSHAESYTAANLLYFQQNGKEHNHFCSCILENLTNYTNNWFDLFFKAGQTTTGVCEHMRSKRCLQQFNLSQPSFHWIN